jgi:hypothetical protein
METDLTRYMKKYNDLNKITEEFGIKTYEHPTLPLVGFKYNQIDSPKYDSVVRWSRGTVLERGSWNIVAQSFYRFFNYGEYEDDRIQFNWSNFSALEKVDGSLMIVYFYGGQWHINTSGSFGFSNVGMSDKTWCEMFWGVLSEQMNRSSLEIQNQLNKDYTYIFELCSIFNKVVRLYTTSTVYFLSAYDIKNGYELTINEDKLEADRLSFLQPAIYNFNSMEEILEFLHQKESEDPTFEGVVLRDKNNIRFKVKSESYLRLHHMFDNGNIANPKYYVPFILKGEKDELISYFPEMKDLLDTCEEKILLEWKNLLDVWKKCYKIESQKEFALAIMGKTKFTSILFKLRKLKGVEQTEDDLQMAWVGNY